MIPWSRSASRARRTRWFAADVLLWLGDTPPPRDDAIWLHARADVPGRVAAEGTQAAVSQDDAASVEAVWRLIAARGEAMVPGATRWRFAKANARRAGMLLDAIRQPDGDPLVIAEQLRLARRALATILGIDATETMLDALFGRFCIGK